MKHHAGRWSDGLAEWVDGDTAYLSVAFTWRLNDARQRAIFYKAQGYHVRIGGPGVFTLKEQWKFFDGIAQVGGSVPDAVARHNPMATFASRGCPVGCYFCIVPAMEGREFTLIPDFEVRPVLCDNNLSALPADYQDHIIARYQASGIPLLDANSGFEPQTFTDEVFARWRAINRGPWRFAYDTSKERADVKRVLEMLRGVPQRKKRVYVLIGNEPMAECIERIKEVIAWGGEPHCQPYMKLAALEKKPHVQHDWTAQSLRDTARWANRFIWRHTPLEDYRRSAKTSREERDQNTGELGL
jgi:hypothetical protein